ncbi:hypothetical protein BJP37_18865 [Moorena bouillonii PNG]|uniref:Transposase IS4-like domain-containing protein n=1 Tax=Moorena bouillonii PNG TaxID=568701 RepID=A0A1U7N492_9CYAN|nr:hypothetical protein BJP37_18865 [Moorena bouillonii PNG]
MVFFMFIGQVVSGKCYPMTCLPFASVYGYFQKWQRLRIWQKIHDQLRSQIRFGQGRELQSTVGIADSQSVKTTEKRGQSAAHDGGKKVKGRKRHIVVDSLRLLIGVLVRSANGSERLGAVVILSEARLETEVIRSGLGGSRLSTGQKS